MEGHGLGLWSVYYLLRLAGGDINVTSRKGHGTEVQMSFPVAGR
jgi:signal transduction histidine kinase